MIIKFGPILSYSLLFLIFIKLISIDRRSGKFARLLHQLPNKEGATTIQEQRLPTCDSVICTRGFYAGYYGEVRDLAFYSRVLVKLLTSLDRMASVDQLRSRLPLMTSRTSIASLKGQGSLTHAISKLSTT